MILIENIRNEEKKKAILEIDRMKQTYEDKQRETMSDLMELEEIHNKRVQDYQRKIGEKDQEMQRQRKSIFRFLLITYHRHE